MINRTSDGRHAGESSDDPLVITDGPEVAERAGRAGPAEESGRASADQTPAAFLSSSARSVDSQVKSLSSRPKWPYADVAP
ncbi:MAG: hypothetical protein JWO27_1883 [Frankiales bacterium]|nr:hypothetical protein [Frankiales bacterium]